MPGPILSGPFSVQDSSNRRSVAVISPNNRVRGTFGFVGTVADQLLIAGPSPIGNWQVPNARVEIAGVRSVGATSLGMAYKIIPAPVPVLVPTGPIFLSIPDPRILNT